MNKQYKKTTVVSWKNIQNMSLTHDVINFLDYKDYQSTTEVSHKFVLHKKFSHFRLNLNVTCPSSTDLLSFFVKHNKSTDINLKDCLSVTDDVVDAVIKSSVL